MSYQFSTLCAKDPDDPRTTKPHQLPIYATSSFEFESVEEGKDIFSDPSKGHLYARFANPTVDAVGNKIAQLEAYDTAILDPWGIMASSGMSAILTVLSAELQSGDKMLSQQNLYGGTTEMINKVSTRNGITPIWTNLKNESAIKESLRSHPEIKVIYFETPSNPALDCIDMEMISRIASEYGLITVVDNTFCSPYVQRPFTYGIDYIIHSTTKYINGHGNSISGVMVGRGKDSYQKVWNMMKLMGTNCNPWDAWLANNGMKTLPLRMRQHCQNALALSHFLKKHDKVESVNYIGLPDHRDHDLAKKQMNGFGGMMCFEVAGGYDAGMSFMNNIKIGSLAPTMGDLDTLIMHPASMSHRSVDREVRLEHGITDNLIRVSVGIEDIEDLTADFDKALQST